MDIFSRLDSFLLILESAIRTVHDVVMVGIAKRSVIAGTMPIQLFEQNLAKAED
jgi:hypothetical protein